MSSKAVSMNGFLIVNADISLGPALKMPENLSILKVGDDILLTVKAFVRATETNTKNGQIERIEFEIENVIKVSS